MHFLGYSEHFFVIPSESEKSSMDGTSQKVDVPDVLSIFVIRLHERRCLAHFLGYSEHFFVIPSQSEESIHTLFVIPSAARNPVLDASLRAA